MILSIQIKVYYTIFLFTFLVLLIIRLKMEGIEKVKTKDTQKIDEIYQVSLGSHQLTYLNKLLPKRYSLQIQAKPIKKFSKSSKLQALQSINECNISQGIMENSSRFRKVSSNISYNHQIQPIIVPKISKKNLVSQYIEDQLKHCFKILNSLKNSKYSWPFREPVDPIAMGVPQYYQIVSEPMDLQTVQKNLLEHQYATATQFHADINKIIRNSYIFNKHNQQFAKITGQFQKIYLKTISAPIKNLSTTMQNNMQIHGKVHLHGKMHLEVQKKKKKSITLQPKDINQGPTPTIVEKRQLSQQIRRLNKEDLRGIVRIVYAGNQQMKQTFDIQDLPINKIRQLQKYVKKKLIYYTQTGNLSHNPVLPEPNIHDNDQQSSFMVDSDS